MRTTALVARLTAEKLRYMGVLERLGEKLSSSLDTDRVEGQPTPSRDWCRAFGHYRGGLDQLSTEQREFAKLTLLREKLGGGAALSDEEYQTGLAELATEAIGGMEVDLLDRALAERGLKVVPVEEDDDG